MLYDYCLSTGNTLKEEEREVGWTRGAIRAMFGADCLPRINLNEKTLQGVALSHVKQGQTVAGVQKKLSLGFDPKDKKRLTIADYPTGYILKPQGELPFFPEAENLVMQMADRARIPTVPHGLLPMEDENLAYICKRIDRRNGQKVAMEDFCQLSKRLTENKYSGSYESGKNIIDRYSSRPRIDIVEYFVRLVFCFLTLNSDMHWKNFSLVESEDGFVMSPAYDLLPVNLVYPADKEETALTLNGKKKGLRLEDFLSFALAGEEQVRIAEKTARRLIQKLLSYEDAFISLIERSYLNKEYKNRFISLMKERFDRLR